MAIRKDLEIRINNNAAVLNVPLFIYELDHGIELYFKLFDYKYKYDKDPDNILNSNDDDILEAYTTIVNPAGYELTQINGKLVDDTVKFVIDSKYTDELDEIGTYTLQIHIKCTHSEFTIPPVNFEVLERLKGKKTQTDDGEVDDEITNDTDTFISEDGKLVINWKKGDIISSEKLNAMVEVINDAVDEEKQRQSNETRREYQELSRQNKTQEALDTVDDTLEDINNRFNALTASQQQDAEVIDARNGEVSLGARLNTADSRLADIENKMYVSVKEFDAKGDGITDDTQAFYDCISYAIENNKEVYIPKGIYILTHNILTFNLLDKQSFVMKGDGASSILKRKDDTVTSDWSGILTLYSSKANTEDIELVKIQDLKIDSNARNQMQPENDYGFEHCYDVRVSGESNSRIKTVHIEGVYATDGVADHIYISGSTDSYIDNFIVNNFQCDYRTRTRSDLCVTGYIKTGMFTNIKCMSLEYEFNNSEGLGDSYIFISNLETESLDLAGVGLICHATNMVVKSSTYLASMKGHITNSSITFNGGRIVKTKGLEFKGCTFYVVEDSNGTINPIYIQYQNIIDFRNCYFKVNSDVEVYEDILLSVLPCSDGMQINIDSCEFDSRAQTAISADRCGTISVSNCKFYNYYPLKLSGASSEYTLNVILNNLMMLGEGYSLNIGRGNITSLIINNMISNEKNLRIACANSGCDVFGELSVDRKIIISSSFTKTWLMDDINDGNRYIYLFNGDTFVNTNSLPNEPRCWRVTTTSYAHNLSKTHLNIVTMNDGVGTTDERPTCYLSIGYQYFDTTLGKTITWNGSDWI